MISKKAIRRLIDLGLNPVPVEVGSKKPIRESWDTPLSKEEADTFDFEEIGIATGYVSLNLEALDFDTKNVEDPEKFMEEYNRSIPKSLLDKLTPQSTPSGGMHYLYRCEVIESNQKLARNKEGKATIETRGIGGYIKCAPSKGYKLLDDKKFSDVQVITEGERKLLFIAARQKDELLQRDVYKKHSQEDIQSFKKFKQYNLDPDIGITLLEEHGWVFHSENGDWYNFTRPESTSGDLHGGYNREGLFFQCFSTAQDTFEERRGYNNHHLFAELECEGNYKKAYKLLYKNGHGVDDDSEEDEEEDGELSFISTALEEDEYLEQARKGEIPLGLSTGWSTLDNNFKHKNNSFVYFLGLDNIGKSTQLSSLMVASNILHGLKFGISSPEASIVVTRRNLIEAEAGRKVQSFRDEPLAYQSMLQKNRKSFFLINNDKHLTIDEVLERGKKLYHRHGIDVLLIDPFSFYSGSGNFSDDTEVLSKIRVFCQNYCTVWVVDHPYTGFTRNNRDEQGFLTLPTKYDCSGGNAKANRCDDFISFHRVINHPDSIVKTTMQISVQKVKDKSTGGEPHEEGDYSRLRWMTRDGFTGYFDENGDNPMYQALMAKKGIRERSNVLKGVNPEDAF